MVPWIPPTVAPSDVTPLNRCRCTMSGVFMAKSCATNLRLICQLNCCTVNQISIFKISQAWGYIYIFCFCFFSLPNARPLATRLLRPLQMWAPICGFGCHSKSFRNNLIHFSSDSRDISGYFLLPKEKMMFVGTNLIHFCMLVGKHTSIFTEPLYSS